MSSTYDGLKLILQYYANFKQLGQVSKNTGIPVQVLKDFLDGKIELTTEQDKILREPLKEFGGEVKVC